MAEPLGTARRTHRIGIAEPAGAAAIVQPVGPQKPATYPGSCQVVIDPVLLAKGTGRDN